MKGAPDAQRDALMQEQNRIFTTPIPGYNRTAQSLAQMKSGVRPSPQTYGSAEEARSAFAKEQAASKPAMVSTGNEPWRNQEGVSFLGEVGNQVRGIADAYIPDKVTDSITGRPTAFDANSFYNEAVDQAGRYIGGFSDVAKNTRADALTPPPKVGQAPSTPTEIGAPAPALASQPTAPASDTVAESGGVRYTYGPDGFTRSDGKPMGGGFMVMPAGAMSQLSPAERASLGQLPRATAQGSSGGRVYGFGQTGQSFQDAATERANKGFEYSMLQTSLQDAVRNGNTRLAQSISSRLGQLDQNEVTTRGQDSQAETARRQAELSLQNPLQLAQAQGAQYDVQRKQMIDQLVNTASTQPDTPAGQQAAAAIQSMAGLEGKGGKAEAPKWITATQEDENGNKFSVLVRPDTGEMIDTRRGIGTPIPNMPGWLLGPDNRPFRDPNAPVAPPVAPQEAGWFDWLTGKKPEGTQ
jgi:hypothetical protein